MKTLAFHELEHVYGGVGSCTAGSNRSCSSGSNGSRNSGCNSDSIGNYCWAGNYRHKSSISRNANSSGTHSISLRGKADNFGNKNISSTYSYSNPARGLEASFKIGIGYSGSHRYSVSTEFEIIKKF